MGSVKATCLLTPVSVCLCAHLYLAVCVCVCLVESEVSPVEQTLGSLAMDAVTLLLTANNSNAGKWTSGRLWIPVDP